MATFQTLLVVAGLLLQADEGPSLKGAVQDTSGVPLTGARIDIATAAPRKGRGLFCPSCYLDCVKHARTDANGRFQIAELDPTLKFRVLVSMVGYRAHLTPLIDPLTGPIAVTLQTRPTDMPPERTVRGVIVDDRGALVSPSGARTRDKRWWGTVNGVDPTVTDTEGRFAMLLPAELEAIDVEVAADGHSGATLELLVPGQIDHRIEVPVGARVTGLLVHQGQPLPGNRVAVVQLLRDAGRHFIKAVAATTDAQGRFEFDYLPPEEPYVIFSLVGEGPQSTVITTKRFKVSRSGQQRDLGALETIPSLRLRGRVTLPENEKIPTNTRVVLGREPAWDLIASPVAEDGSFEVAGLPPETYVIRLDDNALELDPSRLQYQQLERNSFGLRLRTSLEELVIPARVTSKVTE
jgi:hypothetical protein